MIRLLSAGSKKLNTCLIGVVLLIVVFAVYAQVRNHPLLNFDDDFYVSNQYVASGITIKNI